MARRAPRKVHAPPQKNHVTDGIPSISPQLSYLLELLQKPASLSDWLFHAPTRGRNRY